MLCINRALAAKNERRRPVGRLQSFLLHSLIFLHRFGGNRGRGFRAVCSLCVGGGRADGSPCFARRQAAAKNKANKYC